MGTAFSLLRPVSRSLGAFPDAIALVSVLNLTDEIDNLLS